MVTEADPICALQAAMEGYEVVLMDEMIGQADIVVTTTNIVSVNASTLKLQSTENVPDVIQLKICKVVVFVGPKYLKKIIHDNIAETNRSMFVTNCAFLSPNNFPKNAQ